MSERTRLVYAALRVTLHEATTRGNTTTVKVYEGIDPGRAVKVSFDRSIFWDAAGEQTASFMERLDKGPVERGELFEIGRILADIAFPKQPPEAGGKSVRERFIRAEATAKAAADGAVRVQLVISDRELSQLPWEYMAIKETQGGWSEREFLALRRRVSIVRTGQEISPGPVPAVGSTTKIVALLASPPEPYRSLDLDKDRGALDSAVQAFAVGGSNPVELSYVDPPTVGHLLSSVGDSTDFFYFGGHGLLEEDRTNLILQKTADDTNGDPYSATLLGQLLADRGVRLAFLGACDTGRPGGESPWDGAAAELMRADVPFVVAYQAAVLDSAAGLVAAKVWEYALQGYAIDQAVAIARTEIAHRLRDSPAEWGKVVLYLAAGAGDRLFSAPRATGEQPLIEALAATGLGEEFAAWLAERGASAPTTLYRSAISEPSHDLIALEAIEDELGDAEADDPLSSPYRPFKHFAFSQHRAFVRTDLTDTVANAFEGGATLLISGPAGSGKTSLVLAGLGPRLINTGHALIRVAEYDDLAGRIVADTNDLGLTDLPDGADLGEVVEALEQSRLAIAPVIVLDQLEQLADPSVPTNGRLEEDIELLARAAQRQIVRLILVTRQDAEADMRGLLAGIEALEWKPVVVAYLSLGEAIESITVPRATLKKTIYYARGIPERIAAELNLERAGVQPGLLAVVCHRLWTDARMAGAENDWVIDGPPEGGVARILAKALDEFLEENLAGLSNAAREVLGSPDLYGARAWAELKTVADPDQAEAAKRLVQLGLLARRTRDADEYRYSSPAVRDLVLRSQPWKVRSRIDAEATLESITLDWHRGLMPSRGHVLYVSASSDQLEPDLTQCALLIRASLEHSLDPTVWVDRLAALHTEAAEASEVARADAAGRRIGPDSEEATLLGVPEGRPIDTPADVGPYTWWSLNGEDRTGRLTAGLVASVHDFGGRLRAAAVADKRAQRRRQRQLWVAVEDAGQAGKATTAEFDSTSGPLVSLSRSRLRVSRDRRELGIHSRKVAFSAGVALGLLQAVNWLVVGWPSSTRFTDSLGEFVEFLVVGGLLGAAVGLGMQLPETLGRFGRTARFAGGAIAFTVMATLLELSEGREFWRRPVTVAAMAVAGMVVAAAALWPDDSSPSSRQDARWWKLWHHISLGTAAAGATISVLHWVIRLPDDSAWKGILLFAKSRDNYFVIFNQLYEWDAVSGDQRFLYMSLANTALAGLILAVAARQGRHDALDEVADLRRTEERAPTELSRPSQPA